MGCSPSNQVHLLRNLGAAISFTPPCFVGDLNTTLCDQVQDSADKVAEPQRAAQAKEAAVKAAARQKYVHSGPARKSSRAGAQRTKAKLQAQAGEDSEEEHASASSQSYGSDADSKANDGDMTSRKRRRSTQEAEFDPAGTVMLVHHGNKRSYQLQTKEITLARLLHQGFS